MSENPAAGVNFTTFRHTRLGHIRRTSTRKGNQYVTSKWELTTLQSWVETNQPENALAITLIKSLSRAALVAKYHRFTALDALENYREPEGDHRKMFTAILSFDKDFGWAALAYEANLIAFVHSVRNYADLLAQLVNTLAVATPKEVRDCTLHQTIKDLSESDLRTLLTNLRSSHWFQYLTAYSNTAKHRQLIKTNPSVSFVEDASGLKVEAFRYKFKDFPELSYPAYWGHEVLDGAYEVYKSLLKCGQALNRHVLL